MTDFAKELEGKAYQLVNGMIELNEFKAWYVLAQAALAANAPAAFTLTPHQAYGHVSAGRPGRNPEFSDYYERPYEPMDPDMEAHHRKLMGGGDQ